MVNKKCRSDVRHKKHLRIRNKINGTPNRPRLAVYRSNQYMYAQIIDDVAQCTLVSASTQEQAVREGLTCTNNMAAAAKLGSVIGERAKQKGISCVVFDRGGYIYQGRVAAIADAAREAGLVF